MIADTSAVIAICLREPGFEGLQEVLANASTCRISAPTLVEVSVVLQVRTGAEGLLLWESMARRLHIVVDAFTEEHALLARQAFLSYGKGRHPAGLNLGDCFSYALAKASGEPLLFKGDDFRKTDIVPAA